MYCIDIRPNRRSGLMEDPLYVGRNFRSGLSRKRNREYIRELRADVPQGAFTSVVALVTLAVAALVASYLPARRATTIAPSDALRDL
jgi:ABC-type lipoprotein release transport system permease subunit